MITNENEAKAIAKDISCNFKFKLILQPVIQIKNGIIKHVNVNVKIIESAKKAIGGILAHAFVRIESISKLLLIL